MATSFSLGMNWELLLLFKFLSCCGELLLKHKKFSTLCFIGWFLTGLCLYMAVIVKISILRSFVVFLCKLSINSSSFTADKKIVILLDFKIFCLVLSQLIILELD